MVVDGGNLFFPKRSLSAFEVDPLVRKAQVIVDAYNAIGVDAIAVGPYDFAAGYDVLRELQARARFPFLCANILDRNTGQPAFPATRVVTRNGVRLGLIGVIDNAMAARGLGDADHLLRVEAPYNIIEEHARRLKGQGCDAVVVLSAIAPKKFRVMALELPSVALYVAGDPRDKLHLPWEIGSAMIANTTQLGKYLGVAELVVTAPGQVRAEHQLIPLKPDCADDPEVKRRVDGYYRYIATARLAEPEKYPSDREEEVNLKQGGAVYVSALECRECHPGIYTAWQQTPHAEAFLALPAQARQRVECLECHVTGLGRWGGFGLAAGGPDLRGVQCEACHGPGSLHPAKEVQTAGREVAKQCRGCHTPSRSPEFKLKRYLERLPCAMVAQAG